MTTAGADTSWPPTIETPYGSIGTDFMDDGDHAGQHRRVEQEIEELERIAQVPYYDWSVIWDGGSNYYARNHRTAEVVYTAAALHTAWASVRSYAQALSPTGGRVLIQSNGASNAEIPVLDTLQGFDGMHLYLAGYGKRGQTGTGHPDTNVILKVPNAGHSFAYGAGTAMLDVVGTDGYENWLIDGVSMDGNNRVDVTLAAKGTGTGNNGAIFRSNLRGGAVDCLRLGPGTSASTDIFLLATSVSHNGTGHGERALVAVLSGDCMMAYNNFAVPGGNANALYIGANVWAFGCHAGGGSSTQSAIKIVTPARMSSLLAFYLDNQSDTAHGAVWVVPGSTAALALNILFCRYNPTTSVPFVVCDGTSSGAARYVGLLNVIGNWSKGSPSPDQVPAIVKFVNYYGNRETVSISQNQFMGTLKVWDSDGTGSGRPWTWGNKIVPSTDVNPIPAGMYGENFLTGTLNGTGPLTLPHNLYGTPEIMVPGAGAASAGRIYCTSDGTNVYVRSTSSETNLPVSVIAKVIGS